MWNLHCMHLCVVCMPFSQKKKFKVRAHYFKLNANSRCTIHDMNHGFIIIIVIMTFECIMGSKDAAFTAAQPTAPIHISFIIYASQGKVSQIQNSMVWFTLTRCLTHTKIEQHDDFISTVGVNFSACAPQLPKRARKSIACESKHKCVKTLTSHEMLNIYYDRSSYRRS